MVIRKARFCDAATIATIGQCVWVHTYATEGVRQPMAKYVSAEFSEQNTLKVLRCREVFVLENFDHCVGYCVMNESAEPEMETLYVLPQFQNKGYGTLLLSHLISLYGIFKLSCWEKNSGAICFYAKNGFTEAGECYFEFEGEKHRNVILSNKT